MKSMKTLEMLAMASIVLTGASVQAMASSWAGTCTTAPKAQWMTLDAAKAIVAKEGFTVSNVKETRSGNCYEAYVVDKAGKKAELFLDPTTAKVLHTQ
jgi:hypothetical protein